MMQKLLFKAIYDLFKIKHTASIVSFLNISLCCRRKYPPLRGKFSDLELPPAPNPVGLKLPIKIWHFRSPTPSEYPVTFQV